MKKPVRILIVEDKPDDADLAKLEIRRILSDCEFQVVETPEGFLQALEIFHPDVVLSDYTLPRFDGMKALKLTLQHAPLTPLIIWTGSISEDAAVECVKAGANNYILKDNLKRLTPAILRALEEKELLVAQKQAEQRYQSIFENSVEGIFQSSPQGRFLSLNPAMARLYGYASPQEMIESVQDIPTQIYVEPENRAAFMSLLDSKNRVENFEARNYRRDGSVIWTSTSARTVRDLEGKILYYEGFLQDITQRKSVEEALQQSEKRFRALIENGLDDISLLAVDGTLLWESPSTIRNLGYEANEYVGRNIFEIMHPEDLEQTRSTYVKLLQEPGSRQRGTFRLRRADGTWRWVEAIATNMLGEPSVNAIVINYRDITEQKQADLELQQRNADLGLINALNELVNRGEDLDIVVELVRNELNRIFSSEYANIYLLSEDGQSIQMQHYSLPPDIVRKIEKVIGRAIPAIHIPVHQQDGYFQRVLRAEHGMIISGPEVIQKWMAEFIETASLSSIAKAAIRKLLPQIYKILNIKSTVLVPLISDGKPLGLLNVSGPNAFTEQDLGRIENICGQLTSALHRKQVEEALRQSQDRYRTLIETQTEFIVRWKPDGIPTFANEAYCRYFGLTPEQAVSGNFMPFIHQDDRQHVEAKVQRLISGTSSAETEVLRVIKPDGSIGWQEWTHQSIQDEDGQLVEFQSVGRDITERRRAEEKLKESEAKYRTLVEHLPAITYVSERDQYEGVTYISPQIEALGFDLNTWLADPELWFTHIHPSDQQNVMSELERFREGAESFQAEYRLLLPDGGIRWIHDESVRIQDQDGNTSLKQGFMLDITERKRAETERQVHLEIMQALANTKDLPELLRLVHHSIAKVVYAENFFVILHQESSGLFEEIYSVDQYDPPAPPSRLENSITSYVFRSGEPLLLTPPAFDELAEQGKMKLIGTDSASWLGVPLKTSGRTIGVMAVQDYDNIDRYSERDKDFLTSIATQVALVIEHKRAEESLHQSEALYRQAIEVAGAVPYYQSYYGEGKLIQYEFIGEGIRQITGYAPEEFSAALWDSLVEEINLVDDLAGYSLEDAIQRVRTGKNSIWKCEHRLRDREGNLHWVFEAAVELRDENGISYGSIGTYQDITERKRAEQALRESEEHYRTIFEGVQDAIFVESLDGKILMVNERACEMFGYSHKEFLTKTVADLVPSNTLPLRAEEAEESLFVEPRETVNQRANGEIFPIEISGRVQVINGEKVLLVVVRDITERKRSEDLLRESEERFSSAFEYASIGMALVTTDGHWARVNWALCWLLGYTQEDLLQKTFQDITHPDDLENDLAYVRQLLAGEINSYQMEKRYFHKSGHVVWALLSVSLVRDDQGQPQYFISQIQDITERKLAEESLGAERKKAEKYLEIAGVMMLAMDRDGTVTLINQRGCEILGYSADEIIGKNWIHTFLPKANREELQNVFQSLIADEIESPKYYENSISTKSGEERLIAWHNTLLRDEQGTIISTLSSGEDITERKRAEAELRASEERFRQLADNIQEAFWMTDAESGQEIYVSPAAERIWGRSIQSLMYEPSAFLNTVFSEDRHVLLDAIEREKNGEKMQLEYRIVRPDGTLRWIWDRAFPVFDDTGRVKKIAGISADITERRESDMALVKSQNRYRELFDSSPISIWEEDFSLAKKQIDSLRKNGVTDLREYFSTHPEFVSELASMVKITDVNKASLELYGVDRKEHLLHSLGDLFDHISIRRFGNEICDLITSNRFSWEGTDVLSTGRQMEVLVSGSIPSGYEEDWSRVIVSIIDVTERRQAEQELRKLSRAVEQSGSTIVITDTSGNIEYVNPKFTQITGYSYEEVIGQNPRVLKSGFTADEEYKQLWETIKSGREWHGELLNKKKDGTLYWESVTISPVLNDRKEITHYVGVKEDITERKQTEIEIRRHMAELEAVYENGLSVGRLLEPGEIGDRVIETFARYLPWHHVTIRLQKEGSEDLELVSFNLPSLKEEERSEAEQHFVARINKVGQGLSGWVIQTGTPLRTGNVHDHPQYIDTHAGIQSGLYMPLKLGERVIGVISVESEAPNAFTEQDERLLATLANQTAIAFENARLYEAMQKELLERKRVEDALRVSETHYRALADSITDILFELDQDLHYTHWNKASEALTGIPASRVIGKSLSEIQGSTQEQIRLQEIYEEVVKSHQPRTFETVLGLGGETRFFEVNAYPSTRGVSVVAKDVTDRKRTETIMQKRFELMEYSAKHSLNELMLRTVDEVSELTGSTIGFFNFMEDDQLNLSAQTWSTNALHLFRVSPDDGVHRSLDRAGVWAEAVRQRRPLIHNDYEALANRKGLPQGHVPIVRQIVIPIIRNERIMAVLGIANKPQNYTSHDLEIAARLADYALDITERKQMEVALEIERNQLVERVEERTADLSRANSNLARALRVKDEFLANMSHELRTPLNAILGLSESLGEQIAGPLNEKQQKYISTISESGHHLLSLINDILDLAKIEAGQITLDINKVDLHSVCQASLRMIKQLAQKKNQVVSLEIDSGVGLMWADERRLKQMIVNLLGNAVKFTPENGKLGLEVRGDEEANQIAITVWDNGIGIKQDDLTRLFQPFVQLDSGLAREAPGTGLGLALVAQMARLHGGSVNAASEAGHGSRFTIILPWEPALAMDPASRMRITGKFRAIQFDEKNKPTILLVEDTKEVVMMLKDYLELAGYKVFTAQDGIDGIVQARHVKPDLILMDVQMPHMDGFETTRKLRSDPSFRYTPIIALTALAMPHDRERCLQAGMDEYISKPVNLKALLRLIQSCLFEQESRSR